MRMKKVAPLLLVSIVMLQIVSHTAFAEDKLSEGDWEFALAPFYLWTVSLDGDVSVGQ